MRLRYCSAVQARGRVFPIVGTICEWRRARAAIVITDTPDLAEREEPALAREAAAAALATLGGLLATLIGHALTMRVLRAAWPSAFPKPTPQEARNR